MTEPLQPQRWVATFPGAVLTVDDDAWWVSMDATGNGQAAIELTARVEQAVNEGWPELAGQDIDTSPGWDHDWTYLRLAALGATTIDGPNPQAEPEPEPEPGVIVG